MPSPVQTTAGPLTVEQLGRTLVHEHLLTADEGVRFQWPHLVDHDDELAHAVDQTKRAQAHGVETICDPACLDLSRDVRLHLAVAEATGMRFVLATGVYGQHYTFLPHYFQSREVEALVACFVHDLQEGIQGTEVKAHFLKCACDAPGMTDDVVKVHRAVAQASLATGAPIMAHSSPGHRTGLDQVKVLVEEEGVDPAKVMIAHTGDTDDLGYIEELLATGVRIGMDRYGLDIYLPQEQRNATLAALVEKGHADRMVIGQDCCATIDWFPREVVGQMAPKWAFDLIFTEVFGELEALGVAPEVLDAMVGANVHAWLTS